MVDFVTVVLSCACPVALMIWSHLAQNRKKVGIPSGIARNVAACTVRQGPTFTDMPNIDQLTLQVQEL